MSKVRIDYVLDLGGSIVNPGVLNADFLIKFRDFVFDWVKKGKRFAVIAGGGFLARQYQQFLREHFEVTDEDLDTIGIRPTKLNAELLRIILKKFAYPRVIENPLERLRTRQGFTVFVFSGWKPGWSTDYVSVLVAKRFSVKEVISLTNVRGVYPRENGLLKKEVIIPRLSWNEYEAMIDANWIPGAKVPFDPVATKEAKKSKLKAVILQGEDVENLKYYLEGREFVGTVIF
ncbi:MAG: UMP kinase [Candidatus Portnoybacteria bacterium]|nr:UMP kinase [Candidatus Portnoybacteria bacterium]